MAVPWIITVPLVLHRVITLLILTRLPVSRALSSENQGSIQAINFEVPAMETEGLLPGSIQQALDIVRNVQSMPSCAKIASSALLHSCSTLEGSISLEDPDTKYGSDLFIDQEAGIYSVRLAVCELNDADFQIPKACRCFVPTEQTTKKRGIRGYWTSRGPSQPTVSFDAYDEVTLANLKQCRQALSSSAVAWTSYSNNRQNAAVICRAMQSEIAKDDQIEIGKILAETAIVTTDSLKDALEQINDLTSSYRELSTAMPQFQAELAEGNQKQLERTQQFWAEIEQVRDSLLAVASGVSTVREEIQAANHDVTGLRAVIDNAADVSAARIKDTFAQVTSSLSDDLEHIQQLSFFLKETFEQELTKGLYDASRDLSIVNTLMPQMMDALSNEVSMNRKRVEANMEKERLLMALNHENKRIVEETAEGLRELNSTARSLAFSYLLDWPTAHEFLQSTTAFITRTAIYTLLGFGTWEKLSGFSFLSSVFASLGAGIALAWLTANPIDILRTLFDKVVNSLGDMHFVAGIILGFAAWVMASLIYATCRSILTLALCRRKYDGDAEYDPSSPDLPEKGWPGLV